MDTIETTTTSQAEGAAGITQAGDDDFTSQAIAAALAEEAEHKGGRAADAGETGDAAVPSRPDNVPEKFWDASKGELNTAALLQSYGELEKLKSAAPKAETSSTTQDAAETDAAAKETVEKAGLDYSKFTEEYAKTGELSKESREALKAAGLGDDLVDNYLEGVKARGQLMQLAYDNEIKATVGGPEKFNEMAAWAKTNLSAADLAEYNAAVSSGNKQLASMAVKSLKVQFDHSDSRLPELVKTRGTQGGDSGAYANSEEMVRDMMDKRYDADPAYRAQVDAKIGRSAL